MRNLTKEEREYVAHFLSCNDAAFQGNLEGLLFALIQRYGEGYDRIKTLSNIRVGLEKLFELEDG